MFKLKKDNQENKEEGTSATTFENADATAQKIEEGYVSMDISEYPPMSPEEIAIDIKNVSLWYGQKQALFDVTMPIKKNSITALIGPSGCGKSTLLRSINRMNDMVDGCRIEGEMLFHGDNLYAPDVDINALRTRIGMIFQKPNPFPMTIRENITYGPKIHGIKDKKELNEIVPTVSTHPLWDSPEDSSRGCASPARSPSTRKSSSWTSPHPHSIQSPPRRSKTWHSS